MDFYRWVVEALLYLMLTLDEEDFFYNFNRMLALLKFANPTTM